MENSQLANRMYTWKQSALCKKRMNKSGEGCCSPRIRTPLRNGGHPI